MRWQSRQLPAHFGDAGANQGLVADEPEGEQTKIGAKVVSHGGVTSHSKWWMSPSPVIYSPTSCG
jgi:hypothetical protein